MPRSGGRSGESRDKGVEALSHEPAERQNVPAAETQSVTADEERQPKAGLYPRNPGLDLQLVWRGKDEQDARPLSVDTVPLHVQEKIQPKAIVDELRRMTRGDGEPQAELFAEAGGGGGADRLAVYRHAEGWSNRMVLGDSLLVMNSLAETEGLRGRVQTIFFDPPYGISFGTSRQAATRSPNNAGREPEALRAFRDTWQLGIHSYLAFMRDRLAVARALLTETGSIFVQISDENLHLVRCLLDEVFGIANFIRLIPFRKKTMPFGTNFVEQMADFILWYGKQKHDSAGRPNTKYRKLFRLAAGLPDANFRYLQDADGVRRALTKEERSGAAPLPAGARLYRLKSLEPSGPMEAGRFDYALRGTRYGHPKNGYATTPEGMDALVKAGRVEPLGNLLNYVLFMDDKQSADLTVPWFDTAGADDKVYVVQTNTEVVKRCLLMTTDPGDLVLDPTCGSGTTAYVAEQWGRRWITIDTSRVSLALARTRLMAARFPYYVLADTPEGVRKEAEIAGKAPAQRATAGDIRRGFVSERVPHVTLKSIANNAEIGALHERWQRTLEPRRAEINRVCGTNWEAWEVPRSLAAADDAADGRAGLEPAPTRDGTAEGLLARWWEVLRERQREIDASIARNAETEYLHDRPYEDKSVLRVTGPFTVESLSPHRVLPADAAAPTGAAPGADDFVRTVLENLTLSGVQNTRKGETLAFTALKPWAGGQYIHAEGRYEENGKERRAAICIGSEYGTVSTALVRLAAREAIDLFDVLVVCGFAFEAHAGDETLSLGRLIVLKARMNHDLHMKELKKSGAGNLFVVFGEPDITVASGRWLVTCSGRMVVGHERFAQLSGVGRLEEINRMGSLDLPRLKRLALGREVRTDLPGAARGSIGSGEHRGGGGAERDGRIPPVPGSGQGLAGGDRNAADPGAPAGLSAGTFASGAAGSGLGDRTDALRPDEIAAIEALAHADLPLALTTDHWSQVTIRGVDVFDPTTGEVTSSNVGDIACWFIDTDYDADSFFVRHAYFLGARDPYERLKRTLKAEIDAAAWATLHSATSRVFPKPKSGRIAVKVINHYGDEVLKVYPV